MEVFLKDVAKNTTDSHCSGERWSSGTLKRERERDEGGEASRRSQATMGVIKGKTDRPTPCPRHRLRGDTKRTPTPGTMVDLNSFLF